MKRWVDAREALRGRGVEGAGPELCFWALWGGSIGDPYPSIEEIQALYDRLLAMSDEELQGLLSMDRLR